MKVISVISIIICSFIAGPLNARTLQFGFRQGASLWLVKEGIGQGSLWLSPNQSITHDKDIFARLTFREPLAHEYGFGHYRFNVNTNHGRKDLDCFSLKYTAQYDVSYPLLGYIVPFFLKMKSYVGMSICARFQNARQLSRILPGQHIPSVNFLLGFSYSHIIPVSRNVNLTSLLLFEAEPFNKYIRMFNEHALSNRRISWQTGVSFNIN